MERRRIPLNVMDTIMKENGAVRVSDDALEAMKFFLEEYCALLSKKALLMAKHAGRITVMGRDVKVAHRETGYGNL